jgi:hypothetical protein
MARVAPSDQSSTDMRQRVLRYLPMILVGMTVLGLAVRSTLEAIDRGEHTPNLIAAAAAACAAAFIIGANVARGSD